MKIRPILIAAAFALAALPAVSFPASAKDFTVFAAASTAQAVRDVAAAWTAAHPGDRVRTVFGSSGGLARQIESGAPADIFVSANAAWVGHLVAKKAADGETRRILFRNSLVLIAPSGSPATAAPASSLFVRVAAGPHMQDTPLKDALGRDGFLALADPAHAPAGAYAREALRTLGLWDRLAGRIALAPNVRAALALVERGEAPLGIVYRTDAAQSRKVRIVADVPPEAHGPIRYEAVAVRKDDRASAALLAFMTGPEAIDIYRRYGFLAD